MFQNILDYQFKSSILPFDGSGFNNHGKQEQLSFLFDGASQSSGAVRFNADDSKIVVAHNSSWNNLTAIRIEAIIKINSLGRMQIIAEGSYSFSFYVRDDGTLAATYLGPKIDDDTDLTGPSIFTAGVLGGGGSVDPFDTTLTANPQPNGPIGELDWIGVSTDAEHAPDGLARTIPTGQWIRVLFVHDMISMQLYIDDVLSGIRNDVQAGVLGVQAAGVHIGASPADNQHTLDGSLDRIRIWKYDPLARQRRFFCRDMTFEQEHCWRKLLSRVYELDDDPAHRDEFKDIMACLQDAEDALARAIQDKGQKAMELSADWAKRYEAFWCAGDMTSEAFGDFMEEYTAWLGETAGDALAQALAEIVACYSRIVKLAPKAEMEQFAKCDPDFGKFAGNLWALNELHSGDTCEPGKYSDYNEG